MKKLSFLLLLMFLSFATKATSVSNESYDSYKIKAIQLEKWDQSERTVIPNPIECYLMDKDIEVSFLKRSEMSAIIQIEDSHGNLVYQNMEVNCNLDFIKIEIEHLQPGFYNFYYFDQEISLKGKFEIE